MAVGITNPAFTILEDTKPDDVALPPFMVSTTRGFLPRQEPTSVLPPEFEILQSILARMPIKTMSGTPGLLAQGQLGETVLKELPDLSDSIEKHRNNLSLMTALYRDFSFLASAYLLEPCHQRFVDGNGYGLGRQRLPSNIAVPIAKVAAM